MAREIIVIWAGRHRRDAWDELCAPYLLRSRVWVPIRQVAVISKGRSEGTKRLEAEAEAIRMALPSPVRLVAVDRKGAKRSSGQLASWLSDALEEASSPLAFALGSDLGLDQRLRQEAWNSLSLGPMTFPHELARLILLEQLYRALSIRAGIKYHREPL